MDSSEGKNILDPLLVWIEGMTRRPVHRLIEGGSSLEVSELRCGNEGVKDGILFDRRFERLVLEYREARTDVSVSNKKLGWLTDRQVEDCVAAGRDF